MKIENVKIINANETIENATIHIEDGKITKIDKLEGCGMIMAVPGFIDTHMHGFVGHDFMDGKEAVEKITKELAKHGTTSVFPTAMTAEWKKVIEALEVIATTKSLGSKIAGIHLEGPFIAKEKKGAHDERYLVVPTMKNTKEVIDASKGKLKKITIAPELLTKEVAKLLTDNGVTITLGHGAADAKTTREAIKYGATSATHLWNAMTNVENRNPGMAEVFLQEDKVYAELITDLIHVDGETIKLTVKAKGSDKVVVVSDAIRPAGLEDGKFKSGGLDIEKKGQKITLAGTDTIAGSASTIHSNFKNMTDLGFKINEVVAMTSYNAAKSLNLKGLGEIKVGNIADIVIMDGGLDIKNVYIDGKEIKG